MSSGTDGELCIGYDDEEEFEEDEELTAGEIWDDVMDSWFPYASAGEYGEELDDMFND